MNTFVYRDLAVPETLRGIIQHMSDLELYREELSNLGSQWDLLTILGQMNGTGTDMTGTRAGFQKLTSELLGQLGLESLKKTLQALGAKAQVVVDIVIRNLFERTADIGFLATDHDIRAFLQALGRADEETSPTDAEFQRERLEERFREYVAKYSVYYDIVLMDTEGFVVARLDRSADVARSCSGIVREALETTGEYVEHFGPLDLLPDAGDALVYAYRVTATDDAASEQLGVLALCFRFRNEMAGIFRRLRCEGDWAVLALLDAEGKVIASSDEDQVRIGARMEPAPDAEHRVIRFAGREYLARTCRSNGYEGFFGLGWLGQAMLPLEHAFDAEMRDGAALRVEQKILDAVMRDPRLFSEELRSIPVQAERIQSELERTVWNGNVRENDARAKVLLWNISDAGSRTKSVFEKSIGNLHETVVSAILDDVEFQAALAVEIMDRNLYERANDCRWWALTTAFRRILAQPRPGDKDRAEIAAILTYINGLYTVYTNLFIYDAHGEILAVSQPEENRLVGTRLTEAWTRETLGLRQGSEYSVSPFEPSELYGGERTYIYGAAITDRENSKHVLGGIGIVFDSRPQFEAMLRDSLPRDECGAVSPGCFGIFADRERNVLSSTDAAHHPGERLEIDEDFFTLGNGEKCSRIIEYHGQYYAVGACTSAGYREYKIEDAYRNDVIGLVFVPLADVRTRDARAIRRREIGMNVSRSSMAENCEEFATFYVDQRWLGIRAAEVAEAVHPDGMTPFPGAGPALRGKLYYGDRTIPVLNLHWLLGLPTPESASRLQIIIVRTRTADGAATHFGLLVDALAEIPEVCRDRIVNAENMLKRDICTQCFVKPEQGSARDELLVIISPDGIVRQLEHQLKATDTTEADVPTEADAPDEAETAPA